MGIINQGVLGGFSGKVGPVVGGSWKGIDYMRGYVIPANPNTEGQQTQRNKFKACVMYAKQLLTSLINPYWDFLYSKMSGYNAFIKENIENLSATFLPTVNTVISKGNLEKVADIVSAVLSGNTITVSWDDTVVGNGLGTDTVLIVYYNFANDDFELIDNSVTRSAKTTDVVPTLAPSEDDYIFLFLTRGTGSDLTVSDSAQFTVTI